MAVWGTLFAQVILAFMVGLCGAVAQPSFDSMTQRLIPLSAQGRAFARFGMRQQLVWVVGSLIPVIISFSLPAGDATMAVLAALGGLSYASGRRASHVPRVARGIRDIGTIGDVGEFGGSGSARAGPAGARCRRHDFSVALVWKIGQHTSVRCTDSSSVWSKVTT